MWVKAIDRVPKRPGKYFCKKISTGEKVIARFIKSIGRQSIFHTQKNNIMWWDENDERASDILVEKGKMIIRLSDEVERLKELIRVCYESAKDKEKDI